MLPDELPDKLPDKPPDQLPDVASVVVVGAGPTGLALALALARQGTSTVVLALDGGSDPDGHRDATITCLPQHTLAVLARLGASGLESVGTRWVLELTFHGERELNRVSVDDVGRGGRPGVLGVETDVLAAILTRLVETEPRCELVRGRRLTAVEPGATSVLVRTVDVDGVLHELVAAYVVVTVQTEAVGPSTERGPTSTFGVVDHADDAAELVRVLDPVAHPGGQVLVHPMPGGGSRVVTAAGPGLHPPPPRPVTVTDQVVRRFRDGRVLLAGPAAHTTAALTTLGSSAGLDDADDLAWLLARVLDGTGSDLLLDAYDLERRPVAEAELEASAATSRFLALTSGGLRQRLALAGARRQLGGTSVHVPAVYRDSPVLQPGCGAYAPELPVVGIDGDRSPRPLHEHRGGPFLVVSVGPTVAEATELALAVGAEMVGLASSASEALPPYRIVAGAAADATADAETAGAALGNLLVVRPDGRLAWKVNGEDAPDEVATALADALLRACGH